MATVSLPEAARRLNRHPATVRHYIHKGVLVYHTDTTLRVEKLKATKGDGFYDRWKIDEREVERFAEVLSRLYKTQ